MFEVKKKTFELKLHGLENNNILTLKINVKYLCTLTKLRKRV